MKIKRTDNKHMVIHTKEAPKIHKTDPTKKKIAEKAADRKEYARGRWSFIKKSNESIKVQAKSLGVVATATTLDNLEGGEEVNKALYVVDTAARPVIKGARVSGAHIKGVGRQIRKYRIKKANFGKKIGKKSVKKITKESVKKVSKDTSKRAIKDTAKISAQVGTEVASTVAGTTASPGVGTAIGMAAGKAVGEKMDDIDNKLMKRTRMIRFFRDKMQAEDKQRDSFAKLVKDLAFCNMKILAKKILRALAIMIIPLLPLIIIIGAIVGIVMAFVAFIYHTPLALFLPPLDKGESVPNVTAVYCSDFKREYEGKATKHEGYDMGKIVFVGAEDNYEDIAAVYMVKYGVNDTASDMSKRNKKRLKGVFDDMCSYETEGGTEKITEDGKTVSKSCLYVKVTLKTYKDMEEEYNFDDEDKEWVKKIMNKEGL